MWKMHFWRRRKQGDTNKGWKQSQSHETKNLEVSKQKSNAIKPCRGIFKKKITIEIIKGQIQLVCNCSLQFAVAFDKTTKSCPKEFIFRRRSNILKLSKNEFFIDQNNRNSWRCSIVYTFTNDSKANSEVIKLEKRYLQLLFFYFMLYFLFINQKEQTPK